MPPRLTYSPLQLHEMWARGDSRDEIAAALGCSTSHVQELCKRHRLAPRQRANKEIFENDPTPEQIAERAAEIKARHLAAMRAQC